MSNEQHSELAQHVIDLWEAGLDPMDIADRLDISLSMVGDIIRSLDADREVEYDHDDCYDVESALGSIGWGTDEYYGDFGNEDY